MTGSKMTLAQHVYFELPALALCFGVLFIVFSRLAGEPTPDAVAERPVATPGATLKCAGSVVLAVALISSAPLIWRAPSTVPAGNAAGALLPSTVSGWTRRETAPDWQPRARMKTVDTALATYGRADQRISIFMAQATSRRDKVGGGAIDLAGDEMWMPALRQLLSACAGTRCHDVRYSKLLLRGSDRVRHVYTVYAIGGDTMVSPLGLRLRRAWASLEGAPTPARLVAIATEETGGLASTEIAAVIEALSSLSPAPAIGVP